MFWRAVGVLAISMLLATTVLAEALMRDLGRVMGSVVDESGEALDGMDIKTLTLKVTIAKELDRLQPVRIVLERA